MVPNIDLGFAMTAGSADADETFILMKNTIKSIIDLHGQKRLHFAFIVFGDSPTTRLSFGSSVPTDSELKKMIDRIPRVSGSPDMAKGLEEAKKVFLQSGTRPNAEKVLVVMADGRSVNTPGELDEKAKALQGRNVQVIPVLVGKYVDPDESKHLTPKDGDVIKARKNANPKDLGAKIIKVALRGKK